MSSYQSTKNNSIWLVADTLALLPSVKRPVFCVWDRLKMDKHKAWTTTIVAPKLVESSTTKGQMKPTFRVSLTASQAGSILDDIANLNWLICMQDCHCWIAWLEYQGQTRYTRILDSKPFIHASYRIGHRLELKYYFLFAQFLLNSHQAAVQRLQPVLQLICLRKNRFENLTFWTDLRDWLMDNWLVTL